MLASSRGQAFERLRARLPPTVVAGVVPGLRSTGIAELDAVLGGGLLPGSLVLIEGALGSGCSGLLTQLLATFTACETAALLEQPQTEQGRLDPATLAAAGVHLERLIFVHTASALELARACDILLRAGIFAAVALPMAEMRTQVWTRLAKLAHKHACTLIVAGQHAASELRFCATVSLRCSVAQAEWAGLPGIFSCLQGAHVDITVEKNKLAPPGGHVRLPYAHEPRVHAAAIRRTAIASLTTLLRFKRRAV